MIKRSGFWVRGLFVILLLSWTLLITSLRFILLPQFEQQQEKLEMSLSEMMGASVTLGEIRASMQGWTPVLNVKAFTIHDDAHETPVNLSEITIGLNLFHTLMSRSARLDWLHLVGGDISLEYLSDGRVVISGLSGSDTGIPDWLFTAADIRFSGLVVHWKDTKHHNPTVDVGPMRAELKNRDDQHQFGFRLNHAEPFADSLWIAGTFTGVPMRDDDWNLRYYVQTEQANLNLIPMDGITSLAILKGQANLKLWGETQAGFKYHTIYGDMATSRLKLQFTQTDGVISLHDLPDLKGIAFLQTTEGGWEAGIKKIKLSSRPQQKTSDIAIRSRTDPAHGAIAYAVGSQYLEISVLKTLALSLPTTDATMFRHLKQLDPEGYLEDFSIGWKINAAHPSWYVCGNFGALSWNQVLSLAGLDGVEGHICGNQNSGRFSINLQDAVLDAPGVSQSIPKIDSAHISGFWEQFASGWQIDSNKFGIDFDIASVIGYAQLYLPFSLDWNSAFLNARIDMGSMQAVNAYKFIPDALIPETAEWIKQSIHDGWIDHGRLIVQGHLNDFPYGADKSGVFEAAVHLREATLKFAPDWPDAHKLSADITFDGPAMQIFLDRAEIGTLEISELHAISPSLIADDCRLFLTGKTQGDVKQAMAVLDKSPLHSISKGLRSGIEIEGAFSQLLMLNIPLVIQEDIKFEGQTTFDGARVRIDNIDEPVENLKAVIAFNNDGLFSREASARWLAQPISLSIQAAQLLNPQISAHGVFPMTRLNQKLPVSYRSLLSGQLDMQLGIKINSGSDEVVVSMDSDLIGATIDLPEPWGKSSTEPRHLHFFTQVVQDQPDAREFNMSYGTDFRASILKSRASTLSGTIGLGSARLPEHTREQGLAVLAQLEQWDIEQAHKWLAHAQEIMQTGNFPEFDKLNISIQHLYAANQEIGSVSVSASAISRGYSGLVDLPWGKGRYQLILDSGKPQYLEVDLDSLIIPESVTHTANTHHDNHLRPDPRSMPSLLLTSKSLQYLGSNLGTFRFNAHQQPGGLAIDALELMHPNHSMQLTGDWLILNEKEQTHLQGNIHANDLGQLVSNLGYPDKIRDTPADLKLALHWMDWPLAVSLEHLEGDMEGHFGPGGFVRIDVGIGRLFGALSINQIWRRLNLDFSDIWDEGMAYNDIILKLHLEEGVAYTNRLTIDGVAADMTITGSSNLKNRTLDQQVQVIPETGIALPVAGLILGGPVGPIVGAATLVAENLFSKQVGEATQINYLIKGGWDNPEIVRLYGNNPADLVGRAWNGIKGLSGINEQGVTKAP